MLIVADGAPGLTKAIELCWPAVGSPAVPEEVTAAWTDHNREPNYSAKETPPSGADRAAITQKR